MNKTKQQIKEIVKDHLPFLKTLKSETELSLWKISIFGVSNFKEHSLISEELERNKIKFEPTTSFMLFERLQEHENYNKKVEEWNKKNS